MSEPRTLGPWLRRFLAEHIVTERNLARNTQKSYRDTFALLLPFIGARTRKPVERLVVQDLAARRVLQFLTHLEEDRRCSVQTRNQRLTAIRAFARFVASRDPRPSRVERQYPRDCIEEGNAAADRLAQQDRDEGAARSSRPPHAQGPDRTRPAPVPLQHRRACLRSDGAGGRESANRATRRRARARDHPRQGRKAPSMSAMAAYRTGARGTGAGTGRRRCRLRQPAAKTLYAVRGLPACRALCGPCAITLQTEDNSPRHPSLQCVSPASGRGRPQHDPRLAWSRQPRYHQHLRRDRSRDEGKGNGALRCCRIRTASSMEGEQGADGLPWRAVTAGYYVAENMGILMSGATMPALRNIITTATYTQHVASTNRPASSRASLR